MPEALESLEARRAALASQVDRLSRVNRASTQGMLISVKERLAGLDAEIADRHAQTAAREQRQTEELAQKQELTSIDQPSAAVNTLNGTAAPPLPPPPSSIRDRASSAAVLPVSNTEHGLARPRVKSVEERGRQPSGSSSKATPSSLPASRFSNARLSLSGASTADRARLAFLTGGASEAARIKEQPPLDQPSRSTSADDAGKSVAIDSGALASIDFRTTRSVSMADIRAKAAQQLEQQPPPFMAREASTEDVKRIYESSVAMSTTVGNTDIKAESAECVCKTDEVKSETSKQSKEAADGTTAQVIASEKNEDLKPHVLSKTFETADIDVSEDHAQKSGNEDESESESDSDDDFTLGLDTAHLEFLRQQTMLHRNTETAAAEKAAKAAKAAAEELASEASEEGEITSTAPLPSSPLLSPPLPSSTTASEAVASPTQATPPGTEWSSAAFPPESQLLHSPPISSAVPPSQREAMAQQQFELGFEAEDLGHLEAAATAYALCLEWDESRADAGYNLGGVLQDLGRPDEALNCYREVLTALKLSGSTDPSGLAPRAHYNLGLLLDDRGDIAAAIEAYAMAVSLRPDWLEARHNLGVAQGELLVSKGGSPNERKASPQQQQQQHLDVLPADANASQLENDPVAAVVLPERHLSVEGNAASVQFPYRPSGELEHVLNDGAHDPESFWAHPDNEQGLHSQHSPQPAHPHGPYSRRDDESRGSADDSLSDDSSEVASTMVPEDDSSDEDGSHPHHHRHHSKQHHTPHYHHNIETLSEDASTMPPEDDSSDGTSANSHQYHHHLHHQHHQHHHHKHGDHDDVSICTGSSDSSSSYSDDDINSGSDSESTLSSETSSKDSDVSSTSSFEPSKKLHPDSTHHKGRHQHHKKPNKHTSSTLSSHHPVTVPVHEDYELDDGLTPEAAAWAAQYRRNSKQMPAGTSAVDNIHTWRVRASTGSSAEIAAAVAAAHRRASEPSSSLHAMHSSNADNGWLLPYGAQPATTRRESKRKSKREERRWSSSSSITSGSSTEKSFNCRGIGDDDEPLFEETRRPGETDDDMRERRREFVKQWRARRPAPQLARDSKHQSDAGSMLPAPKKPPRIGGNLAKAQRLKVLRDNQRLDMLPEIIREREDQRLGVIGRASSTPSQYPSSSSSSPRVTSPRESLLLSTLGAHNHQEGPLQQHAEQRRIVEEEMLATGSAVDGKQDTRDKRQQRQSEDAKQPHERRTSTKELGSSSTALPPAPMTARLETPYYTRRQSVPKAGDPCSLM